MVVVMYNSVSIKRNNWSLVLDNSVLFQGALSYVPQQAWIQNMTLRDNILFSKSYNKDKYEQVLDACALVDDLKILAGGDQTEIGERVCKSCKPQDHCLDNSFFLYKRQLSLGQQ